MLKGLFGKVVFGASAGGLGVEMDEGGREGGAVFKRLGGDGLSFGKVGAGWIGVGGAIVGSGCRGGLHSLRFFASGLYEGEEVLGCLGGNGFSFGRDGADWIGVGGAIVGSGFRGGLHSSLSSGAGMADGDEALSCFGSSLTSSVFGLSGRAGGGRIGAEGRGLRPDFEQLSLSPSSCGFGSEPHLGDPSGLCGCRTGCLAKAIRGCRGRGVRAFDGFEGALFIRGGGVGSGGGVGDGSGGCGSEVSAKRGMSVSTWSVV